MALTADVYGNGNAGKKDIASDLRSRPDVMRCRGQNALQVRFRCFLDGAPYLLRAIAYGDTFFSQTLLSHPVYDPVLGVALSGRRLL